MVQKGGSVSDNEQTRRPASLFLLRCGDEDEVGSESQPVHTQTPGAGLRQTLLAILLRGRN